MILPSQYYEENLYPLQDGVMSTISKCGVRFFLTGGTALSRAYYNHRYSDDLDFFVNDVASHFGGIVKTELFDRTDSIRNMLSNKITALFRFAGKDVADIREIALRTKVDWRQAIQDARQKEAGIEIPIVCDILKGIPKSEFETVVWTKKPDWEEFRSDIDRIVYEMMSGENI